MNDKEFIQVMTDVYEGCLSTALRHATKKHSFFVGNIIGGNEYTFTPTIVYEAVKQDIMEAYKIISTTNAYLPHHKEVAKQLFEFLLMLSPKEWIDQGANWGRHQGMYGHTPPIQKQVRLVITELLQGKTSIDINGVIYDCKHQLFLSRGRNISS